MKNNKFKFQQFWDKYSTGAIVALMVLVFGILEPSSFLKFDNLIKITEQSSITILLACGEFFAILLAGIDLSVGSVMALSGVVTAKFLVAGFHPVIAVLLGVVVLGALLGALNGALVNVTGLPPFIITLGTQLVFRGVTMIASNRQAVAGVPGAYSRFIAGHTLFIIPNPFIIAALAAAVLTFFSLKTKAGRNIYAIGGNAQAAWFAGINIKVHTLLAFIISGICSSLAGMVNVARLSAAEPNAGTGYETYAIAAVIIGGTSFFGGQGVIPKVVVGGIIIGVINNGLNMIGLSSFYQQIAMGSMIIIAVTLDRFFGASSKMAK
ncbi:MAG: D-allose ABC transporter permease [Spirochaetaceae bacterium]|jgi:D-allose transport system permease protein|nr:D-allose ABC transporter permease [Spirochaetaceae bacterium]